MPIRHRLASGLLLPLLLACSPQPSPEPSPAASPSPAATDAVVEEQPHRAHWEVDGEAFHIESETVTGVRMPAPGSAGVDHVMIELRSANDASQLQLQLFIASDSPLEGEHPLSPIGGAGLATSPGRGTLQLITGTAAGRSVLLAGEGQVRIEQQEDVLLATFSFAGDGRIRAADASPVTGELRIRRSLTRL